MAEAKKTTLKKSVGKAIPVLSLAGEKVGEKNLPEAIFNAEAKPATISQYIRVYMINQRQATASTQTRSEVSYSTKKIYRQKGTGGARHGSRKAPIFVGGGVTFGPKPRDLSASMNKKQKKQVLFSSLSMKNNDGKIMCITNEVTSMQPKTKEVAAFLKKTETTDKKILVVLAEKNNNFVLSARNIPNVHVVDSASINPYLILSNDTVIFTDEAIDQLEKHFMKQA